MADIRSTLHNKRYFAVVVSLCKIGELTIKDFNPVPGIRDFTFSPSRIESSCGKIEGLRALLKKLDLEYPRDEHGEPISSAKLSDFQLDLHIEAMIKFVYDAGSVLKYEEDKKARDEVLAWSQINTKFEE